MAAFQLRASPAFKFHDLRNDSAFAVCLNPDSYVQSQTLTERLLAAGSLGTWSSYPNRTVQGYAQVLFLGSERTPKPQISQINEPVNLLA